MSLPVDYERAQALMRDALAWLAERNIPPTPENFDLGYSYVSREQPALRRAVDGLIAEGCIFDAGVMTGLHQRFLRTPQIESALRELGEKMGGQLDSILRSLKMAGDEQFAYGQTLSKASGDLGQAALSGDGIKTLIDRVADATRIMETRSKALEQKLQISALEVMELRTRVDSIRRDSLTDPLTGMPNRRAFDANLQKAIESCAETGRPLSLIMCDIDRFKTFNDNWGHQVGDHVLRLVAKCVSENVKSCDTAARFGGEEFAVILPETGLAYAKRLADQVRAKLASREITNKATGDVLGTVTISAGVAQYCPGEPAAEFIQRADACLYAAKRAGRNRVVSEADAPARATA